MIPVIPRAFRAPLIGGAAILALVVAAWAFVAHRERQAALAERERIEMQERREAEAARRRIQRADRSIGDADADLRWLIDRFGP